MNSPRTLALIVTAFVLVAAAVASPSAAAAVPSAVAAAAAAGPRPGCADSWRNPAGGLWSSGPNWSAGQPPAAHQAACITRPLRGPVVLNGPGMASSLLLGSTDQLILQGGTLTPGTANHTFGNETTTASWAEGGNAANASHLMSSGRTDLKTAWSGSWVRVMGEPPDC